MLNCQADKCVRQFVRFKHKRSRWDGKTCNGFIKQTVHINLAKIGLNPMIAVTCPSRTVGQRSQFAWQDKIATNIARIQFIFRFKNNWAFFEMSGMDWNTLDWVVFCLFEREKKNLQTTLENEESSSTCNVSIASTWPYSNSQFMTEKSIEADR